MNRKILAVIVALCAPTPALGQTVAVESSDGTVIYIDTQTGEVTGAQPPQSEDE